MKTQQQKGLAIIIALLMVALVTVIGVQLSLSFNKELNSTFVIVKQERANAYIKVAEMFGLSILLADYKEDNALGINTDNCLEAWATETITVEGDEDFNNATFSLTIQDATAKFNINSLVFLDDGLWKQDTFKNTALVNYLSNRASFPVDFDVNVIAGALGDWIDSDDIVSSVNGAESSEYDGHGVPNHPITDIDELLVHPLFETQEARSAWMNATVSHQVVALPYDTKVNVNTAPSILLQSTHPLLTASIASDIVKKRPFRNSQEALSLTGLSSLNQTDQTTILEFIDTASEYYYVYSQVETKEQQQFALRTLTQIDSGGKLHILERKRLNEIPQTFLECGN